MPSTSHRRWASAAALFAVLTAIGAGAPGGVAHAASVQNFQVRTASDLVTLCDAQPGTDNYTAAANFCEGFGVGAYQYYQAQTADDPDAQYVCPPSPAPTRNQIVAAFVAWAKAHPEHMGDAPVDALFRFLGETYPCPR